MLVPSACVVSGRMEMMHYIYNICRQSLVLSLYNVSLCLVQNDQSNI